MPIMLPEAASRVKRHVPVSVPPCTRHSEKARWAAVRPVAAFQTWQRGEVIVRREINWQRPSLAMPVIVVDDTAMLLATYVPGGSPFAFGDETWPSETGRHPWWPNNGWRGSGTLMLQRPGEAYSVWLSWNVGNPQPGCHINLQEPFRRTAIGFDTQDHELDVVVLPDGQWFLKDADQVAVRVRQGRYSEQTATAIHGLGNQIGTMLDEGTQWWRHDWERWTPDPGWARLSLAVPDGWTSVRW